MIQASCPICDRWMEGEATDWPYLPFCSERCRTIDLGRWLSESYRIPDDEAEEPPDEEDDVP